MSRSPVADSTAPAPKNSRLLKREWLNACSRPAVRASAATEGMSNDLKRQREPKSNEDDADVLDGVVGEQALEVVLHQRVEHAEQGGARPDRQNRNAPPPVRRSRQFEHDPDEAVDGDLRHHPAHQRGDMARRGRVGERQPDVQRHDPGLRARADQRQHEGEAGDAGRRRAPRAWRRRRSRRPGPRARRRRASSVSVPKLAITI